MASPDVIGGVGAWKVPPGYRYRMRLPVDPYQLQRVRWAVVGIQRALIQQGHLAEPGQPLKGGFGPATSKAVKAMQASVGLTADGVVGPRTARRLFDPYCVWWEAALVIPDNLLFGLARLESAMDPGAEGLVDERDRGIVQFNRRWHPDVPDERAFSEPTWCLMRAAGTLRDARDSYGRWDCAVAHWNSPVKALEWARNDAPPDEVIANYVRLVYAAGAMPV